MLGPPTTLLCVIIGFHTSQKSAQHGVSASKLSLNLNNA